MASSAWPGGHPARLEARPALGEVLLPPGVALEPGQPAPHGRMFRKPARLSEPVGAR